MPFQYEPKIELSEAELFGQLNEARRGAIVPREKRVSLAQAYTASAEQRKQAEPTPLQELAEQSKVEHPFVIPGDMLPPGSKFRPAKESLINPTMP